MSYPPMATLEPGEYQCYILKVHRQRGAVYATIQLMDGRRYTAMIARYIDKKTYYQRTRGRKRK